MISFSFFSLSAMETDEYEKDIRKIVGQLCTKPSSIVEGYVTSALRAFWSIVWDRAERCVLALKTIPLHDRRTAYNALRDRGVDAATAHTVAHSRYKLSVALTACPEDGDLFVFGRIMHLFLDEDAFAWRLEPFFVAGGLKEIGIRRSGFVFRCMDRGTAWGILHEVLPIHVVGVGTITGQPLLPYHVIREGITGPLCAGAHAPEGPEDYGARVRIVREDTDALLWEVLRIFPFLDVTFVDGEGVSSR